MDLLEASEAQGHTAVSLCVGEQNPARALYESAGFVFVEQHGPSWTMVRRTPR